MIALYHDRARGLLVYRTGEPDRVLQYIPEAKRLNGSYVAAPATLHNAQLLRILDYPVPGIMEASGYDWPIERGRKPLAHQKLMAEFMVAHPRCFNLSDMGTMKTLATLWAADFVMQKENCRAVIVAPLSILQRVWGDAIFANFLGRRTAALVYGSAAVRSAALAVPADFYIINFDGVGIGAHTRGKFLLAGLSKELHDRTDIRLAIVDECSAYRDSRTKRHRIAREILGRRDYLWQLTGTPTPNGPTDAYGLAKLANNAKGESYTSFHNRTMMRVSQFKWIPRAGSYEAARALLSPAIRFDIKDVWDGPEMTTQQREVALTDEQKRAMGQLKRDLQIVVKSGHPITAVNEAAARQKFIQISLGAVYDEAHDSHVIDAAPRIAELKQVIENAPGKILCFVPFTSVVNMLYKELKDKVSCAVVNGNVSQRERSEIFSAFQQSPDPRLLIADPGTMAHGLDLFMAQTVVWYGATDKTELYLQANKRAHRPGQKHPVTIVQLVSTALEREIYRRLENNEGLQGLLLEMVREGKL
jgi:SNF2 family DNA or RNA helicase